MNGSRAIAIGWFLIAGAVTAALGRLLLLMPWTVYDPVLDARLPFSAGPFEWGLTLGPGLLGAASSGAVAFRRVDLRRGLAMMLLALGLVLSGARASGHYPLPYDIWHHELYAMVLTAPLFVGLVGLARRARWSRWLVLALGWLGSLTGALGLLFWVGRLYEDDPGRPRPSFVTEVTESILAGEWLEQLWTALLVLFASATLVLLVSGAPMREVLRDTRLPMQRRISLVMVFVAAASSLLCSVTLRSSSAGLPSAVPLGLLFLVAVWLEEPGPRAAPELRPTNPPPSPMRVLAGPLLLWFVAVGFAAQAVYAIAWRVDASAVVIWAIAWVAAGIAGTMQGVSAWRSAILVRTALRR